MEKLIKSCLILFLLVSTVSAAPKYSSGKNSYTPPSKPSSGYTAPSSKPSYTSKPSSGSSYTSGSKTYSSGVSKSSSEHTPSVAPKTTPSHEYSSGSKKYSSSSTNSNQYSTSKKVDTGGGWYDDLSSSGKQKDSQDAYNPPAPYVPPKYEYKTPAGQTKEYNYSDVNKVRNKVDYEKYQQYDTRNQKTFEKYSGQTTTPYNDAINVWFWLWLLDQSLDTQAEWVYNHKNEIDEARYKEILKKTPGIDVKLDALEKSNKEKDPSFVPPAIENDADLQYNKDYVEKVIRPVKPIDWAAVGSDLWVVTKVVLLIAAVAIFVYYFAIKDF